MTELFVSKPQEIEAVHWDGTYDSYMKCLDAIPGKVARDADLNLLLLAGKNGEQGWVPVPTDYWLVHPPGDLSDVWPVEARYFEGKYDRKNTTADSDPQPGTSGSREDHQ